MGRTAARPARVAAALVACMLLLALAACAGRAPVTAPAPPPAAAVPVPPTVTRGQFTLQAVPLDAWNAIGDIIVRTPGASYDSRSRMLGLYSVRYRDEPLLIVAHAVPLSDTVRVLTTEVTAKSAAGAAIDSDAVAELLAILQRELPAEIERVHARLAAQAAAEAGNAKTKVHKARAKKAKKRK